jgi:hypothetical protein
MSVGATLGGLFALAVVSFADCVEADCSVQRVVGVLGHAIAGGGLGTVAGLLLYLFNRLAFWLRK